MKESNIQKIWNIEKNTFHEYVIWGTSPNGTKEVVLISKYLNDFITNLEIAEKLKNILEEKYKCTNCRIQTL